MKTIFAFLFTIFLSTNILAQNLLPEVWKFKTGDDQRWSAADYNDSGWQEIIPGSSWEKQGYAGYDGFAWYRVTVNIPSSLKAVAKKYGGFALYLGKIDDVDQTFFNGRLIGSTGELPPNYITKYNADRKYIIPVSRINWDKPNVIAVRVFDLYGDGGIYSFPVQLTPKGLTDDLSIEPRFKSEDFIIKDSGPAELTINLNNSSRYDIVGKISIHVVSDFGNEIAQFNQDVVAGGRNTLPVSFEMPGLQPGFYKATVTFNGELANKMFFFGFGFNPELIISPVDTLNGFTQFWTDAKKELAAVDPDFKMTRVDSLCTKHRNVYLVEMHSLGDVLIRGWYSVPSAPGKYPAIMQVPGYTSIMLPEYVDYGDDIIGFALNIRGHGNSRDDVNPGFPGFLLYGLADKETYIYRGAYMDCTRGIDFLFSRPEVDTTRVAVEGGSQGGALTFATSALNNTRIKACAPLVPFLSDFRDYFKLAIWPANEFIDYVEKEKKMNWDDVYNNLSYFDIKNLAGWIRCPMFMGVGLVDDVCPPHTNFAAYNQVHSPKQYVAYPEAGHSLPEDYYTRRMAFLRNQLELKP